MGRVMRVLVRLQIAVAMLSGLLLAQVNPQADPDAMSSMSIVGYEPGTGEVGIALASKFFAVAPIAAHVRVGVGAIATMGGAPHKDGKLMLDWLEEGASPQEVLDRLSLRYPQGIGQINIADTKGRSISTTSTTQASMWKGHRYGKNYAAAGNILVGPEVVEAFARTFEQFEGSGLPLADRLLAALDAADQAGGDARGRMGATLIVMKKGAGFQGMDDYVNIRVDDSRNAVNELKNLYARWKHERAQLPGFRTMEQARGRDVQWLQKSLRDLGYLSRDDRTAFDEKGEPRGLFNDATADAATRFKKDHNLGATPSAGLETVNAIRREMEKSRGREAGPQKLKHDVAPQREEDLMSSMSIVGYDPETGDVGICLASKFFAVGPIAAFARAGAGAVAIMGNGPFSEGERILDWMDKERLSPTEVLARLRALYPDTGQINIVNVKGESLSTTGPTSSPWKGHRFGKNYAAAGNILAGPAVVDAFADTFERTEGSRLPLAERLLQAMEAADRAGGDARGRQGAALKVYREGAGFRGTDLLVDLRVDDSAHSTSDLRRLWEEWKFHHLYGVGFQPIEQTQGNDVKELQKHLLKLGYIRPDNRSIFDEKGEPRGVFNDATAEAVIRWKKAAGLDESPYLVPFMLRDLAKKAGSGDTGTREPADARRQGGGPTERLHPRDTETSAPTDARVRQQDLTREEDIPSSMSIVGFDPKTGEVGIAMASRVFAVGYIATHVRGGVGAVATMGGAPHKDGRLMLDWMEQGSSPEDVLARLGERYPNIGQINIVDVQGRSISTTGPASEWKGHRYGKNYAAAGNILAGPDVVNGFADTFERTEVSGLPLAERLMMAIEAADRAGGDARGRMGAALKVYKPGAGYVGTELYLDLRVDDSPNAIDDLRYLYERWKVERLQQYGSRMILETDGNDVRRLQAWLLELGYVKGDNRAVFDERGQPRGLFNDATAEAVIAFKRDHQLGTTPDANREVIIKMIKILEDRARGRGVTSFWKF